MILQSIIVLILALLANTINANSDNTSGLLKRDTISFEIFNKTLAENWNNCSGGISDETTSASPSVPTLTYEDSTIVITLKQNEFLCLQNNDFNSINGKLFFEYKLSNAGNITVSSDELIDGIDIEYKGNDFVNASLYFENQNINKFVWKNKKTDDITLSMKSIVYENYINTGTSDTQNGNSDNNYIESPTENEDPCLPGSINRQSKCDDGYYLLTRIYYDDRSYSYELASTNEDGDLFRCKSGKCNRMYNENNIYGFFMNADKNTESIYPIIKCVNSNESRICNLTSNPTINKCSQSGDLIEVTEAENNTKTIKVCLSNSNNDSIPIASKNISYKYINSKIFNSEKDNENILIVLDNDSVHTAYYYTHYFLINENSKEIYSAPDSNGNLYVCEKLNCNLHSYRSGYYFNVLYKYDSNVAPYIQCRSDGDKCQTININNTKCSSKNEENAAKAGELFKTIEDENEIFNICLDTTNGKEISLPIKYEYKFTKNDKIFSLNYVVIMLSTSTVDNIFGYKLNKYIMAYIYENNIIRYNPYSFDLYQQTYENYIIINEEMIQHSDICDNKSNIIEFELICMDDKEYDNHIHYYRKIEN